MNAFTKELIIAIGIFIIGSIITLVSSAISKNILRKFTLRTNNKIDDYIAKSLIEIIKPLGFLISFFIAWASIPITETLDNLVLGLIKFICLILVIRLINKISQIIIKEWSIKVDDKSISTMLASISPMIRAITWCIGIVFYLQNMGVQMTAVWALLSAGGIGAGLALKEPVQEFFEYITILLDKPFQNGQFIHIEGVWAKVETVGVRSTRLRSINGEIIVMSNSRLTNGVISNYAEMNNRRLVHKLGVVYETSHQNMIKIPEVIKDIVENTENAIFDRCHFIKFGDFSLDFELVYFIPTSNYIQAMTAQQNINLGIMKKFEEQGIEFAFPTQTLNLNR
ncbi:mechanosensitive ion channel family protein [Prochlorococcus sp. MIT 1223]|uniref:mechanosensitive ion channel family protein n=1 Tax=Prochlorococcus sp. MIT 1223 TaxID=3096217 RepID=UPI002A754A67|nr:mechanosensitive ion channel domain-containing protein [Prochlorococcus sp. MIT 1223]